MYWNSKEMRKGVFKKSWIVTLDVLKYLNFCKLCADWNSWIVTLDVLKWFWI